MKVIIFNLLFLSCISVFGQVNSDVNLFEYIKEIQKWDKTGDKMALTFWIPNSYWSIALSSNNQVPPETIKQIENAFENYVFICALDVLINSDGTMTCTDESELSNTISLVDNNGKIYLPLSDNQISPMTKTLSSGIKPMFVQMLGQMGKGMYFYFFEVNNTNHKNLINEFEKGGFTIKHSNKEFKYILPLVTLLPPKFCPIDNEQMKGNWNYCPIHGVKIK
jgi:hypothetical protein